VQLRHEEKESGVTRSIISNQVSCSRRAGAWYIFESLWYTVATSVVHSSQIQSKSYCVRFVAQPYYRKFYCHRTGWVQRNDQRIYEIQDFRRWWGESQRLRAFSCSSLRARSDLERSTLRNILFARLKELGQRRPRCVSHQLFFLVSKVVQSIPATPDFYFYLVHNFGVLLRLT
jgi:hypothetical protein